MIIRKRALLLGLLVIVLVAATFVVLHRKTRLKPVVEMYDMHPAESIQSPIFYVDTDERAVALTLDISWGEKMPDKILDVLAERGQKATFFLSGPWSNHYQKTVKRIVDDGHEIASHGQDHIDLGHQAKDVIRDNIESAHNILVNVSGVAPRLFRPPNGDYSDVVILAARELGYETIIWAVDSRDWQRPGASYIVERVSTLAFRGAILLFHASDSAPDTPEALPRVLDALEEDGYKIMTLGELLSIGKPMRDDPRGRPQSELPQ